MLRAKVTTKYIHLLLHLFLILFLVGCSSKKPGEATELLNKQERERLEISLDTPETQLLEDGKKYFNSELYTLARKNFESLRTGYPNSPYVDFAEIKIADSVFESGNYSESAKLYEDFTKRRPTHPSNVYMLYRAALSNHLSHTGVGRDPTPLKRAIELYDQVLTNYPNSEYEGNVLVKKKSALETLKEHEDRIQTFYSKKNIDKAVESRKTQVENRLVPIINEVASKISQPDKIVPEGVELSQVNTPKLVKVDCITSTPKKIVLYLNGNFNTSDYSKIYYSNDSLVSISTNNLILPNQIATCFAQNDIEFFSSGKIAIKTNQKIKLLKSNDQKIQLVFE